MTDIFIRTYYKDIEWLAYCLASIAKFGHGFRQIIVCIPENQKRHLDAMNLTAEKVVTCPVFKNDYLGQQITKLNAWQYTDAEYILFVDSDCCFTEPFTPEDFMEDGKPLIYKTHYSKVGDAICWKVPTESFMKLPVEYEYMRRLPLMYRWDTLSTSSMVPKDISQDIMAYGAFSEFNYLGAWAELYQSDKYVFADTDHVEIRSPKLKQNWSHGGLTPEIREELGRILA